MSALVLRGVAHAYGAAESLRGVDLAVEAGEIVCLVGPSGCGKSTLLRLAAGLERPARGEIEVGGRLVAAAHLHVPPERRGVGMVFQDFALFPHLEVAANVGFGLARLAAGERARRVADVLAAVGLTGFAARMPHSLSGGEAQRVALARALAPRPQVLLLDEPFSGLDAAARQRVREETRAILRASGTAALLVTHDGDEAMALGERVALMRAGALVQTGTPEEIYFRPVDAFAATFFGEANRLDGSVRGGVVATPLGALPANGLAEGRAASVLVRPEALELAAPEADGTPVRVLESRLLSGRRSTTVALGAAGPTELRLVVLHSVSQRLAPGASVRLRLQPELAHVFAREAATG